MHFFWNQFFGWEGGKMDEFERIYFFLCLFSLEQESLLFSPMLSNQAC